MQIFFGPRLIIIDHFSVRQIFEAEVKRKISILQARNNSRLHCQLQDPAWNVVNVVTGREWSPLILTTHSGRGCIIIMLHFMLFTPRAPQQCTPVIEKKPSFEANHGSRSSAQNVGTSMLWLDVGIRIRSVGITITLAGVTRASGTQKLLSGWILFVSGHH